MKKKRIAIASMVAVAALIAATAARGDVVLKDFHFGFNEVGPIGGEVPVGIDELGWYSGLPNSDADPYSQNYNAQWDIGPVEAGAMAVVGHTTHFLMSVDVEPYRSMVNGGAEVALEIDFDVNATPIVDFFVTTQLQAFAGEVLAGSGPQLKTFGDADHHEWQEVAASLDMVPGSYGTDRMFFEFEFTVTGILQGEDAFLDDLNVRIVKRQAEPSAVPEVGTGLAFASIVPFFFRRPARRRREIRQIMRERGSLR